jgi:hypothetical protein
MLQETVLYRPVGQAELDLIKASGWSAFPPRLPEQPIFYPVLNKGYAVQIARDWNTSDDRSGRVGYVLRFAVRSDYLERYEIQRVGGSLHEEYWIPAEDLDAFNDAILWGHITVIDAFIQGDDGQPVPAFTLTGFDHGGVWDAVYERLSFKPSTDRNKWPVWNVDGPSTVFSFEWPGADPALEIMNRTLDEAALDAMRRVVPPGNSFVSLDWQHETFEVWPHAMSRISEPLPTPILPNGDYYLHVDSDLRFGFLGQPWEATITVFGSELMDAFEAPPFLARS